MGFAFPVDNHQHIRRWDDWGSVSVAESCVFCRWGASPCIRGLSPDGCIRRSENRVCITDRDHNKFRYLVFGHAISVNHEEMSVDGVHANSCTVCRFF